MTIWFHEGLPRSGKSYEAMVKHVLPAIKSGRLVVTNIKGVDTTKIADVLDLPFDYVDGLVIQIPWSDTKKCLQFVKNDCLLLLDEVQDFWPSGREKLPPDITELITQHGQRGMDIILMGQSQKDCHNLWRRRIDKLVYFVQKDSVGKPTEYFWRLSKCVGTDKFVEVSTGSSKYDSKFFGIYKSHVDGVDNKEAYEDERANVWSRPSLRYGIPAMAIVGLFAIGYIINFFMHPSLTPSTSDHVSHQVNVKPSLVTAPPLNSDGSYSLPAVVAPVVDSSDLVADLLVTTRPRLSAFVSSASHLVGKIEFYTKDTQRRKEVLTFAMIEDFGWQVERKEYGIDLEKNGKIYPITAWPFDVFGSVPSKVQQNPAITGV